MAVKRVILQQFSMQLSYMNASKLERANIYQPSFHDRGLSSSISNDFSIPDVSKRAQQRQQTESSGSDEDHYEFKRDSESCDSHPASPSDHFSDEDLPTILDNVSISSSSYCGGESGNTHSSKAINCKLIDKTYDEGCCKDAADIDTRSPLQSRRGRRQLYIVCPQSD